MTCTPQSMVHASGSLQKCSAILKVKMVAMSLGDPLARLVTAQPPQRDVLRRMLAAVAKILCQQGQYWYHDSLLTTQEKTT